MSSSCSVGGYCTRLALCVLWLSFLGPVPGCGDDSLAEMLGAECLDPPATRTISVEQHAEEVRSGHKLEDLSGEDA
jgi:hypothetical protein